MSHICSLQQEVHRHILWLWAHHWSSSGQLRCRIF
jgi:hypothetical protein